MPQAGSRNMQNMQKMQNKENMQNMQNMKSKAQKLISQFNLADMFSPIIWSSYTNLTEDPLLSAVKWSPFSPTSTPVMPSAPKSGWTEENLPRMVW